MRYFLLITALVSSYSFTINLAHASELISPFWLVKPDTPLKYETITEIIRTGDKKIEFDLDEYLVKGRIDETLRAQIKKQFESYQLPEKQVDSMISILENKNEDLISLKMVQNKTAHLTKDDLFQFGEPSMREESLKALNNMREDSIGEIQLRANINNKGKSLSSYLPKGQINLVNLQFQLPSDQIKVGDHWSLDGDCLSNASPFEVEDFSRVNRVEFNRLFTNQNGEKIAEFDYLLLEKLTFSEDSQKEFFANSFPAGFPSEMSCIYIGRHHFNVNKGRLVKTYAQMMMSMGNNQTQISSAYTRPTDMALPKPKPKEEKTDILDKWKLLQEQSDIKKSENDKPTQKLFPKRHSVILNDEAGEIGKTKVEYSPGKPLPFLGWNSGVCFVLGKVPNASVEAKNQLLEKTFGSSAKNTSVINGEIFSGKGVRYELGGTIDIEMLVSKSSDSEEAEMHVCTCVACSSRDKDKPESISSISFQAKKPFQAQSIYWLTDNDVDAWGETEDPLHRWRLLQEERMEKQMKSMQEEKKE